MRSNTKKAKQIIRSEIRNSGFSPKNYGEGRSTLDNIKINADAHNAGMPKNRYVSDYTKCTSLVDGACFEIGSGQNRMLTKIYGKISTHSPRAGRTVRHLGLILTVDRFQLTRPVRGEPNRG